MTDTILDTDTLSEVLKERDIDVINRSLEYMQDHGQLSFTSVSVSELMYGLYVKDAKRQIEKAIAFLKLHDELVPSSADYWLSAEINAALKRHGKPIGNADPLIAACAINREMVLATGNSRQYEYVHDVGFMLKIDNWRSPRSE